MTGTTVARLVSGHGAESRLNRGRRYFTEKRCDFRDNRDAMPPAAMPGTHSTTDEADMNS